MKAGPDRPDAEAADGKEPLTVVGIGASAGGLQALREFFEAVPADSEMAYVVIVHLDPERESMVAELLERWAAIPVVQATEAVVLEPGRAYVIPPNRDLRLADGRLETETRAGQGQHAPIDLFFRTLADGCGENAVGVVLSGTGSDGTMGLQRIKEAGGITVAQTPAEAEYDAMPRNAVATGQVDFVLPAAEIPGRLLLVTNDPARIGAPGVSDSPLEGPPPVEGAPDTSVLHDIFALLRARTGHDFTDYRRSTILRRIERRLQFNRISSLFEYRDLLQGDPEEVQALLQDFLISVSGFFRDPEGFAALEQTVIPAILQDRDPDDRIRVWVPACATGEEAYSLAMLFAEHAATLGVAPEIQLFATDIDERACAVARIGRYPETIAADVTPERLERHFTREAGTYRVAESLRAMVLVARHDLLRDPPFSSLDLISCRNLLIYLQPEAQSRALATLHYALRPDGFLFVGTSETAESDRGLFVSVDRKHRIYRRGSAAPHLPTTAHLRGAQSAAKDPARERPGAFSYGPLHLHLLETYASPSLVVDEDHQVVHLSEHAGDYLRIAGGEPNRNVLSLVPPEMRTELRTALHHALRSGRSSRRSISLPAENGGRRVEVTVCPAEPDGSDRRFALVLFAERAEPLEAEAPSGQPGSVPEGGGLEEELVRVRGELSATIEDREKTIEELQAANEELQSINEEQKATSEELETSREELQSINEELIATNQEHRATIDELEHTNADLHNLMDATELGTIFLDREFRVRRFTPAATQIFNLLDSDRGRPLADLANRLQDADLIGDAQRVLSSLQRVEREVQGEDGKWFTLRVVPYRSADDRIDGVVLTFFDITPQKLVESKVRAMARRREIERANLSALMDQMQAAVLIAQAPSGRIARVNQRFRDLWAGTFAATDTPDARSLVDLAVRRDGRPYPPDQWPIARALDGGELVLDEEVRFRLTDGQLLTVLLSVAPVSAGGKEIDTVIVTMTDITRRVEWEEALDTAKQQAEGADLAKTAFLSSLSHELRTPLSGILLNAEVLLSIKERGPEEARMLERIKLSTRHLTSLIDQLLDIALLEEGRHTVRIAAADACEITREAAMIVEPEAGEKGLALDLDVPEGAITVETDCNKVRQILLNLLGNAIKYSEHGTIRLAVHEEGDRVAFRVQDEGVGIASEDHERIFERFVRVEDDQAGAVGGTGLGLAVVRRLARLLGGDVEVESEVGRGSTFTVWLPREQAEPHEQAEPGPQTSST